jgi:hypothetical protein
VSRNNFNRWLAAENQTAELFELGCRIVQGRLALGIQFMFSTVSSVWVYVAALFAGILVMLKIGRILGLRRLARHPKSGFEAFGAMEGVIFGLLSLLIAFEFSGAGSRFDKRRDLIVQEANAIGTAYLRIDLLPAAVQPALRDDFRKYLDSRLASYQALPDLKAAKAGLERSTAIQARIWNRALQATKTVDTNGNAVTSLVLSSLNDMFDITTTRAVALQTHPPAPVFVMLTIMVLAGALLAGYVTASSETTNWFHVVTFAVLLPLAIYITIDYEYPRGGLIRIDTVDQQLRNVRASMK